MEVSLFGKIIEQLMALKYKGRISFHFYNEPLLCPDLDSFTAAVRRALPECFLELYTNGTLLTLERLETLSQLGVSKFTVTRHAESEHYPFEALLPTLAPDLRRKIRYQKPETLLLTNRGGLMKGVGACTQIPPLDAPCFITSCALVITAQGNVIPCFEDYLEKNVMGNLQEMTLLEIWNSEKYRQFRTSLKTAGNRQTHPVCRDCNSLLMVP